MLINEKYIKPSDMKR